MRTMPCALTALLTGMGLIMSSAFAYAQTDPVAFQITNRTLSGGDPTFPVITDVTFQNLVLTEFVGGAPTTITLYDPMHTVANTLDTSGNDLESNPFTLPTGGFFNVSLTGSPDITPLQLEGAPGGPISTTGPLPFLFADFANSTHGDYPAIGQLSLFDTVTGNVITMVNIYAVPEPGWAAMFVAGGIGFALLRKRRTVRSK